LRYGLAVPDQDAGDPGIDRRANLHGYPPLFDDGHGLPRRDPFRPVMELNGRKVAEPPCTGRHEETNPEADRLAGALSLLDLFGRILGGLAFGPLLA
jgi:hypothetical protein